MKKGLKMAMFALVTACSFTATANAESIKESVADYKEPVFILGSTRLDSSVVISAEEVMKAGFNEALVKSAEGNDIYSLDYTYTPEVYYYNPEFDEWYEIAGEEKTKLTEIEVQMVEENLDIYYVNNNMKTVEYEYSGTVDEDSLSDGVTYEDGKFLVPAIVPSFNFEADGKKIDVVVNDKVVEEKNALVDVGGIKFSEENLLDAIYASSEETPAVLLRDYEASEEIVIDSPNKTHVLDLGGHTLSAGEDCVDVLKTIGEYSVLTIQNGNIIAQGSQAVVVGKKELEDEPVTLNIAKDVTISGFYYALYTVGDTAVLNLYGKAEISDDGAIILGNGTVGVGNEGTEINIYEGSTLTAEKGYVLYSAQSGVVNIKGGTFTANTILGIKAGQINIDGGTFTAIGEKKAPVKNNNGINVTGDVIYVEINDGYAQNIDLNVNSGTFASTNGYIIQEFKDADQTSADIGGSVVENDMNKVVSIDGTLTHYTMK